MKQLEPGRLYRINKYFWYMFPTRLAAIDPDLGRGNIAAESLEAQAWVSYWSAWSSCTVSLLGKGDTFMVVEVSGWQVKVVDREGNSGWINFPTDRGWTEGTIAEAFNDP